MSGENQPPFRMPCEAVAGKPNSYIGNPFSHDLTPILVDKHVNITTVPNPNTDIGGTVPPYERWTQDMSGGESCEVHHCNTDPGAAPCSAWLKPFTENVFSHAEGDKVNFAVARKTGFKNVMARRLGSGISGWQNKLPTGVIDSVQCCADGSQKKWLSPQLDISGTKYLSISVTAKNKFPEFLDDISSPIEENDATVTQSIDANSGLPTSTISLSPNDDRNTALGYIGIPATLSAIVAAMTSAKSATPAGGTYACSGSSITIHNPDGTLLESLTWDLATGTASRQLYTYVPDDPTPLQTEEEDLAVSDSSFSYHDTTWNWAEDGMGGVVQILNNEIEVTATLSGANTSASLLADIKDNLLSLWPLNDDALYPWRSDLKVSVAPLVSRDEILTTAFETNVAVKDFSSPIPNDSGFSVGATIGDPAWDRHCGMVLSPDPNTGVNVVAVPLDAFDGSDIDITVTPGFGYTTTASITYVGTLPPGISFDTSTGIISGTATATGNYGITVTFIASGPAATGAILGAPKPAGYQNFFNFGYIDMVGCCFRPPDNPGFQTWSWYQVGWGMDVGTFNSNTGCQLPLNTTQWNNYFEAANKPQGAWIFYADKGNYYPGDCVSSDAPSGAGDGGYLVACKYVEALEIWPSQNFARPAGDDKFLIDENRVYCAVNASGSGAGSTWTLTQPLSGLAPDDGTNFFGLWGGPVVGGFYNVTSYSAGVLTLGSKVFDVPSNWASKSNSDEATCFGRLRFETAPALLGHIAVTPDTTGTIFTFSIPQPAFGLDTVTHQEQVDLYDASMTLLAANVTATRENDSSFTIAAVLHDARWVTITGQKYYWNDNTPKGDYSLLQWMSDFRSLGESVRLTGVVDCDGNQVAQPHTNAGGGALSGSTQFKSFSQTAGCLPFVPCSPRVVCISPNGETFPNGHTYDFPTDYVLDEQYGSKWWAFVQSTMTDLFWQQPHRPCNIETCAKWVMDGGICSDDVPGSCPGDDDFVEGESEPPIYFFEHAPQVEARLTVPGNYGPLQNESPTSLSPDIQIGWLSPVLFEDGDVALPPVPPGPQSSGGTPAGANTAWDLHALFCAHASGCRFDYQLPGC